MGTIIESVGVVTGDRRSGSVELAARAARRALELAGCDPGEVGFLINAGVYRDENICEPAMAPFIQERIGMNPRFAPGSPTTFSFDIRNGTCGLITGVEILDGFLSSGAAERGLVVTSDIDPTPRVSEGFEFAPTGGAILLRASPAESGFSAFHSETTGKHSNLFDGHVAWIGEDRSGIALRLRANHALRIRQSEDFATQCAECAGRAVEGFLAARDLAPDDLDLVVPSASPSGFAEILSERIGLGDRTVRTRPGADGPPHTAGPAFALAAAVGGDRYREAQRVLWIAAGAGITVSLALYSKRPGAA